MMGLSIIFLKSKSGVLEEDLIQKSLQEIETVKDYLKWAIGVLLTAVGVLVGFILKLLNKISNMYQEAVGSIKEQNERYSGLLQSISNWMQMINYKIGNKNENDPQG